MRKELENRVSMIYAVKGVCDAYTATWTPLVPYTSAHTDLLTHLGTVEDKIEVQEKPLEGITKEKAKRKLLMVDGVLTIAQAVYAYATDQDDLELQGKTNYSRSSLIEGRDAVVGQRCQGVMTEATTLGAALVPYGVTAAELTAGQTLVDEYVAVVSAPRTAVTIRKGATEALAEEVKVCMDILNNRMDKLMPQFRAAAPAFYKEYFNARIIVDLGGKEEDEEPAPPMP